MGSTSLFLTDLLFPSFSCSQLAGGGGGLLLVRLSVASPEDLTEPSQAERLMQQVSECFQSQESKMSGSQGQQGSSGCGKAATSQEEV